MRPNKYTLFKLKMIDHYHNQGGVLISVVFLNECCNQETYCRMVTSDRGIYSQDSYFCFWIPLEPVTLEYYFFIILLDQIQIRSRKLLLN